MTKWLLSPDGRIALRKQDVTRIAAEQRASKSKEAFQVIVQCGDNCNLWGLHASLTDAAEQVEDILSELNEVTEQAKV